MSKEELQRVPLTEGIKQICRDFGIRLKPEIGQHLLVDEKVLKQVVKAVPEGKTVIEIGAGPGQLTEALAPKSRRVVAIEIDPQFGGPLEQVKARFPNVDLVFENALEANFDELADPREEPVELAGNLPYHITEPLMRKISPLLAEGATFLVGEKFAREIEAGEDSPHFGELTLLTSTFFVSQNLGRVDKGSFYPRPRTDSALMRLTPRAEEEIRENKTSFVLSELFSSTPKGTLTKNVLREALIRFEERETSRLKQERKTAMTKNEARAIIATLDLPGTLLNKSAGQLSNEEFGRLHKALRQKFGPLK